MGTQNSKQRYRCSECLYNFFLHHKGVQRATIYLVSQMDYGDEGLPIIGKDSGMSQSKIQRSFREYLKIAPLVPIRSKTHVHLLMRL